MVGSMGTQRGKVERGALPPGPRMPAVLQALGLAARPVAFLEGARARYGRRFTVRVPGLPPWIVLSDPDDLKQLFLGQPDALRPGEGSRFLKSIVGPNALGLLDEDLHLEKRKLILPVFHSEQMHRLGEVVAGVAAREVDSWPRGETITLYHRMHRITLEVILRALFGLEPGPLLNEMHALLTKYFEVGDRPVSMVTAYLSGSLIDGKLASRRKQPITGIGRLVAQIDELIYKLIEERRDAGAEGADLLTTLLNASHEDGSPVSSVEVHDELMGVLTAGHVTSATQLAWACERLSHEPQVLSRLYDEIDDSDEAYLTATIQEILRQRPVFAESKPRLTTRPVKIGDVDYPAGVLLIANAYLLHHDPAIYPEPHMFRPERFLERPPGTYTWIPFGGGRRRCIGASFAMLEMRNVLRAVLERYELCSVNRPEAIRRNSFTLGPADRCQILLRDRRPRSRRSARASIDTKTDKTLIEV
jgi:cytochrome P450